MRAQQPRLEAPATLHLASMGVNPIRRLGVSCLAFIDGANDIAVRLHARLRPDKLDGIVLHELDHVPRLASGQSDRFSRDELEAEADAFACKILARRPFELTRDALVLR